LRAHHRATARFALNTDVARFYHSIYTHSIPWAIHGKATAKRNRSQRLLGNAIDQWVRNGQDGQTMGIPIGPDTSLIIAEVLLSAVDRSLARKLPRLRGFRFIDDYELTFATRPHAEIALRHLQAVLSEFELALNSEKTVIDELPCLLDPAWKTELRAFRFREGAISQRTDIITYFDRAYSLARSFPGKSVLAYAIARLRGVSLVPGVWPILQDLVSQCILIESGAFSSALLLIAQHHSEGGGIDLGTLAKVMNMQIAYHAPLGHGSEVAWALWACLSFGVMVVPTAAKAVSKMNDSVVALSALHAKEVGRIQGKLDTDNWRTYLTPDDLWGPQWLLSYEAFVKGWLKSPNGKDHFLGNESFEWLRDIGVEFYDRSKILTVQPGQPADDSMLSLLLSLKKSVALSIGQYEEDEENLGETDEPTDPASGPDDDGEPADDDF
jgi:hypothetical protein